MLHYITLYYITLHYIILRQLGGRRPAAHGGDLGPHDEAGRATARMRYAIIVTTTIVAIYYYY